MTVTAGFSRVSITPSAPGLPLGGWPTQRISTGVEADIDCRAIAISDGTDQVVVIVFDLLGLSSATVSRIQGGVSEASGVATNRIHVASTHTHTAPQVPPFITADGSTGEPAYIDTLLASASEAAVGALAAQLPVHLGVGEGSCDLGVNRRLPGPDGLVAKPPHANFDGPVDRRVKVARFDTEDGSPRGVVVSYGCHPTTAGESTLIGPDYVGVVRDLIEEEFPGSVAVFLLGYCGDVRSCHVTESGRFDWTFDPDRVRGAGEKVGRVAVRAALEISTAPHARLATGQSVTPIESTSGADLGVARVSFVGVGPWRLLLTPAELFSEVGQRIEGEIGDVMPATLTDGYLGYVAPEHAYDEGGYEVEESHIYFGFDSPVHRGSADRLVQAAVAASRGET